VASRLSQVGYCLFGVIFKVSTAGSVAGFGGHLRSRSYIGESNCPPDLSMNFDSDTLCDLVIYFVSTVVFFQ
jgi:hypothetical protein